MKKIKLLVLCMSLLMCTKLFAQPVPNNFTWTGHTTFDASGTMKINRGGDATGDLYYRSPAGTITRLGIGTAGQALLVAGGIPAWGISAGGGTLTNFSSGNLSPLFTTSVLNSTTTPAQSFTLSNATAFTVFGRASGTGAPSYLSLDSNFFAGNWYKYVRANVSANAPLSYNSVSGIFSADTISAIIGLATKADLLAMPSINIGNTDLTLTGNRILSTGGNSFTVHGNGSGIDMFVIDDALAAISLDVTATGVIGIGANGLQEIISLGSASSNQINIAGVQYLWPTLQGAANTYPKNDGSGIISWVTIPAGTVTSVSGTTNRITVATGTTTPVIDISAAYVGQASLVTLGTVATGVWNATSIDTSKNNSVSRIVTATATGIVLGVSGKSAFLSLSAIPNSSLANSTISGISLGSTLAALSVGYGLSGSNYTGAAVQTWKADTNRINGLMTKYYGDSLIGTKQLQLNGTGFVKATGTTISYDNSTYTPTSRTISTTAPLSGGGDLSANRTLTTSMATNKLIGRGTAGTGVMEEITLGTNLSLSGTTLNASGSSSSFPKVINNGGTGCKVDSSSITGLSTDTIDFGNHNNDSIRYCFFSGGNKVSFTANTQTYQNNQCGSSNKLTFINATATCQRNTFGNGNIMILFETFEDNLLGNGNVTSNATGTGNAFYRNSFANANLFNYNSKTGNVIHKVMAGSNCTLTAIDNNGTVNLCLLTNVVDLHYNSNGFFQNQAGNHASITQGDLFDNCMIGEDLTIIQSAGSPHENQSWGGGVSTFSVRMDVDIYVTAGVLDLTNFNYAGRIVLYSGTAAPTVTISDFTGWSPSSLLNAITFTSDAIDVTFDNSAAAIVFPTASPVSTTILGNTFDYINLERKEALAKYIQTASVQY